MDVIPEKTNIIRLKTPEGILFSLHLAGPVTRFVAWLIDVMCIVLITILINRLVSIFRFVSPDLASAFMILGYFFVSIGYSIVLEWYWRGQTIGKRLLRLRVMDERGLRLQFSQIVIRNLLRFIDSLPLFYMVGGLACIINPRFKRLGDVAANTIVVWSPKTSEPDLDQLLEDKYNSLLNYPHLGARLRQKVSPAEANIALQALLRRNELEPGARITLFRDIAAYFRSIVPFPQEASDGVPDEQYVRNVVDVLYKV